MEGQLHTSRAGSGSIYLGGPLPVGTGQRRLMLIPAFVGGGQHQYVALLLVVSGREIASFCTRGIITTALPAGSPLLQAA